MGNEKRGSWGGESFRVLDNNNDSMAEERFLDLTGTEFEENWDGPKIGMETPIAAGEKVFFFCAGSKVLCLKDAVWYEGGFQGREKEYAKSVLLSSDGSAIISKDEVFLDPRADFNLERALNSIGMDDDMGEGAALQDCEYVSGIVISG